MNILNSLQVTTDDLLMLNAYYTYIKTHNILIDGDVHFEVLENIPVGVVWVEASDVDLVFVAIKRPAMLSASDTVASVIHQVTLKTKNYSISLKHG